MQPADLRFASSDDCPRLGSADCWRAAENPFKPAHKNAAAIQVSAATSGLARPVKLRAIAMVIGGIALENQFRGTEQRKKGFASVDVAKAIAGGQHGGAAGEDDIFRKRRAVGDAGAIVHTNGVANRRLQ